MAISDYLENKLIDHLFRSTALAQPAGIYLALGTAASDSSFTELSGGGYARINLGRGDANWNLAVGTTALIVAKESGAATGNWGDITKWALYDAASGGNMLYYGDMAHACRVYSGEKFSLPAYGLTLGFN